MPEGLLQAPLRRPMQSIGLMSDLTPEEQAQRQQDVAGGLLDLSRGVSYAPFDLLGAPVDIVNMALSPMGLGSEKPIFGSEHLIELYGSIFPSFKRPEGGSSELAGRIAGGFVTPASIAAMLSKMKPMKVSSEIKSIKQAKKLRQKAAQSDDPREIEEATSAASILEAQAAPLTAVLKRIEEVGETPQFVTKDDGTYLFVRPSTLDKPGGEGVVSGAKGKAKKAERGVVSDSPLTKDEIRAILDDPNLNSAYQTANKISVAVNGVPYDLNLIMAEKGTDRVSSLAKQGAIGRAFMMAAGESPEYKAAVFEAYGREYPELLEAIDAKNYDDLLQKAYAQLAAETKLQFGQMPISTTYHRGDLDYVTSSGGTNSIAMLRDVIQNQNMNVFRGGDPHDFLYQVDPETGLNMNEMFRAVHDYFGHGIKGNKFDATGEEIAYGSHSQMYSPLARMAMASETRGQNSLVNYSPMNIQLERQLIDLSDELRLAKTDADKDAIREQMKLVQAEREYAPQKSVLLPPEMLDPSFGGGMPEYLRPINRPEPGTAMEPVRVFHASKQPGLLEVDPAYFGSRMFEEGYAAPTERSLLSYGRPERSYFFQDEYKTGDPATKGDVQVYEGLLSDVYDAIADPVGLVDVARFRNRGSLDKGLFPKDFEQAIKDYGYSGYSAPMSQTSRAVQAFYPTPVKGVLYD